MSLGRTRALVSTMLIIAETSMRAGDCGNTVHDEHLR